MSTPFVEGDLMVDAIANTLLDALQDSGLLDEINLWIRGSNPLPVPQDGYPFSEVVVAEENGEAALTGSVTEPIYSGMITFADQLTTDGFADWRDLIADETKRAAVGSYDNIKRYLMRAQLALLIQRYHDLGALITQHQITSVRSDGTATRYTIDEAVKQFATGGNVVYGLEERPNNWENSGAFPFAVQTERRITTEELPTAYTAAGALRTAFETATSETANSTFAANVLQPVGTRLYIGCSNDPGNYDGALVTRTDDGVTLTTERVLDEQGVHDMQYYNSDPMLYVPGTDPTESWDFGNLYLRAAAGTWTKRRTIPRAIHVLGLYRGGVAGPRVWVGIAGLREDGVTESGRVLMSADHGATWTIDIEVTDTRVYDITQHGPGGHLYCIGRWLDGHYSLHRSTDGGSTWGAVGGVTPTAKPRMVNWLHQEGAISYYTLIVACTTSLYVVNSDGTTATHALPFTIPDVWNPITYNNDYVFILDNTGQVWYSADLVTWTKYVKVTNAITIAWWEGVGLMIADSGLNARVWRA